MPTEGTHPDETLTIALVAGEASGDNLGAPLIRGIKARYPDTRFVGIGGPAMIAEGLTSWVDIDRLSVNGFVDPIRRLPELLRILFMTRDRVVSEGADCYIGVDSNFFNLLVERMLKRRGIKTAHYVSPTVWAWRKRRIKGIRKSVDLMMTLYPFETDIYEQNDIDVVFVGHPKAEEIDPDEGSGAKLQAREGLGFDANDRIVAILPGSRGSEVKFSGPDFLNAANRIAAVHPDVKFVIPAASANRRTQIETLRGRLAGQLDIRVIEGRSQDAMRAADVVLVNSGTATLEAMLLKRPMVMSYRLGAMTYAIVSRMMSTLYFALPNILAKEALIPELIQDDATPEALAGAVLEFLESPEQPALIATFDRIHRTLRQGGGDEAAKAILKLCGREVDT